MTAAGLVPSGDLNSGDVGLDQLLVAAATGGRRFLPGGEVVAAARNLARKPRFVGSHTRRTAQQLARVVTGSSKYGPASDDRRFRDPAWQNWLFRRIVQQYLALSDSARILLEEADLDWAARQRASVMLETLIDTLAPTNNPITNPTVLKATIDQGGTNLVRGARQWLRDMQTPTRLPASVDPTPFEVGTNLAVSPGAVVHRTEMFELLQYTPATPDVHRTPVLIVPPMISKFYVVDLAPGKSMVEHLGSHGVQPFAVSWRNVGRQQSAWGLDDYIQCVLDAIEVTRRVTRSDAVHLVGFCAGGVAATVAAGYLAAHDQLDRIASLNLNVTVLDMDRGGPILGFASRDAAAAAGARVRRKGYLPGTELSRTFAWLRPAEMIWSNFVNNYYLGQRPPAFDLLYWNLDSMNMPAALHGDMLRMGLDNPLPAGELVVLDTKIDLSRITCDAFVVGGETDHITPWANCFRSGRLLGGTTRFALSTGGHIAAVIHPAGSPKSAYWVGDDVIDDADAWMDSAERRDGTWWSEWTDYIVERSAGLKKAPRRLGSTAHRPVADAPGTYVLHRTVTYSNVG